MRQVSRLFSSGDEELRGFRRRRAAKVSVSPLSGQEPQNSNHGTRNAECRTQEEEKARPWDRRLGCI